jgi:signal transduction histidine kinase
LTNSLLFERLSAHRTVGSVPQNEIRWIAEHGKSHRLEAGNVLTSMNGQVAGMHVVLSGHLTIHVDRGAGRRKIMEWRDGDVTGLMPYSRLVAPPGDVIAEEPTDVLTIDRVELPEMIRECPELTTKLVHVMLDRARLFTSSYLHDEKLVSLGKLAAGLAHEFNNPASAITRSASILLESLTATDAAGLKLAAAGFRRDQITAIETVRAACVVTGINEHMSPLQMEEREDAVARWLKKHNVRAELAEPLCTTSVTIDLLNQLTTAIEPSALDAALEWIAGSCATRGLAWEIHEAGTRISDLVGAIKGFTEMDRATVPEPVHLQTGLASTLVVLRAKAKGKSIHVSVKIDSQLPPVRGFGGELNQVWANLIDNAIDAANEGGNVEVSASCRDNSVIVRVVDDGPGIPQNVRDRIFDPFFTTKPVGAGMGLGLDIVRRLVFRHNGQIEVDSKPGRTEFCVTLPVAQSR